MAGQLKDWVLRAPPELGGPLVVRGWRDLVASGRLLWTFGRLPREVQRDWGPARIGIDDLYEERETRIAQRGPKQGQWHAMTDRGGRYRLERFAVHPVGADQQARALEGRLGCEVGRSFGRADENRRRTHVYSDDLSEHQVCTYSQFSG